MTEFYQGFWWCFPLFLVGFFIGRKMRCGDLVATDNSWFFSWLVAFALLGIFALYSGFPII